MVLSTLLRRLLPKTTNSPLLPDAVVVVEYEFGGAVGTTTISLPVLLPPLKIPLRPVLPVFEVLTTVELVPDPNPRALFHLLPFEFDEDDGVSFIQKSSNPPSK